MISLSDINLLFSDFMEIYVEIFSTSTEFLSANLTIFSKSGW